MAVSDLARSWTWLSVLTIVLPLLIPLFRFALGYRGYDADGGGEDEDGGEEDAENRVRKVMVHVAYGWTMVMFVVLFLLGRSALRDEDASKSGFFLGKKMSESSTKNLGTFLGALAVFSGFCPICALLIGVGSDDERRDDEERSFSWSSVVIIAYFLWTMLCASFCVRLRYHLKDVTAAIEGET